MTLDQKGQSMASCILYIIHIIIRINDWAYFVVQLPGTDLLKDYVFKFGRRQLIDLPLTINPTGCARTEPKLRTHFRK